MISLLLTLFICLFSFSPTLYQVDREENNIVECTSQPVKNIADYNDGVYFLSSGDITFDIYYDGLVDFFGQQFAYDNPNNVSFTFGGDDLKVLDYVYGQDLYELSGTDVTSWFIQKNILNTEQVVYTLLINYPTNKFLRIDWVVIFGTYAEVELNGNIYVQQNLYSSNGGSTLSYWPSNKVIGVYGFSQTTFANIFVKNALAQQYQGTYAEGYNVGFDEGYRNGYYNGDSNGYANGYQQGYTAGYSEASSVDTVANTIFTGIFDVGLLPVNVFLTIFNFEVFGVNISGIIGGLLTLSVVIIILRFLLGGKKDD